jgi:hypothetical protein
LTACRPAPPPGSEPAPRDSVTACRPALAIQNRDGVKEKKPKKILKQ